MSRYLFMMFQVLITSLKSTSLVEVNQALIAWSFKVFIYTQLFQLLIYCQTMDGMSGMANLFEICCARDR